jgi:hypothetical protein
VNLNKTLNLEGKLCAEQQIDLERFVLCAPEFVTVRVDQ